MSPIEEPLAADDIIRRAYGILRQRYGKGRAGFAFTDRLVTPEVASEESSVGGRPHRWFLRYHEASALRICDGEGVVRWSGFITVGEPTNGTADHRYLADLTAVPEPAGQVPRGFAFEEVMARMREIDHFRFSLMVAMGNGLLVAAPNTSCYGGALVGAVIGRIGDYIADPPKRERTVQPGEPFEDRILSMHYQPAFAELVAEEAAKVLVAQSRR